MVLLLVCALLAVPLPAHAARSEADLFAEAESRYLGGTYAPALEAYDGFIAAYPRSSLVPDAHYRRAVALLRLERWQEASDALREVETRWRTTRWIDYVPLWQGVALYQLGSWSLALASLDRFLAGTPDPDLTPQALLHRGLCLVSLNDPVAAEVALAKLLADWPKAANRSYAKVALGTLLARRGSWAELAELTAGEPAGTDPWRERLLLLRSEALWATGRRDEAAGLARGLVSSRDDDIALPAYQRLFAAAEMGGDLPQMQSLTQAAEVRFASSPPVLAELWTRTGVASYRRGNRELAEYFLARVWGLRDRTPVDEIAVLYLAEALLDRGDAAGARGVLETFLASGRPGSGAALMSLGDAALETGDFAGAAARYAEFLEAWPASERRAEAGYLLAYSRYRQGRYAEAAEAVGRFAGQPGPFARDLGRLRVALLKREGRLEEALAETGALVAGDDRDARARLERMKILFQLGRLADLPAEADALFVNAPGLATTDPYAFLLASYLRGLGQVTRKEWQAAAASLDAVNAQAAERAGLGVIVPWARYYLGWAAVRGGSLNQAAAVLDELAAKWPSHELAQRSLFLAGWAQFSLKAWDAAADRFARASAGPDRELVSRSQYLRAKSLQNAGRLAEASTSFRAMADAEPRTDLSDDALYEYASITDSLGSMTVAADAFARLASEFPDSPFAETALFARAEALRKGGRNGDAQTAYALYRRAWPKGTLVDASLYWGGVAAVAGGEPFAAVLVWEQLIAGHPASPFRASAMLKTAEVYAGARQLPKALELYDRIRAEYPEEALEAGAGIRAEELRAQIAGVGDREAELLARIRAATGTARREAQVELARLYVLSGEKKVEDGYKLALQVASEKDPLPASRALAVAAEYWYRKGDLLEAARKFLEAAATGVSDAELAASSIYRAAEMMRLAERPEDVRELVRRLEEKFPASPWTARARKLVGEAGQ
ncbi:MAG: tetratricopeptide repeat protein [Spirochaetes bacterium]|nr:tetratricopeptide repeat protein [Spirochaetota bacterium]